MKEQKVGLTRCPSCHSAYRVPLQHENRKVKCKSCGTSFEIAFDPADNPQPQPTKPPKTSEAISPDEESGDDALGKLALKFGLITQDQLQKALARKDEMTAAGDWVELSDVFLKEGLISREQMDHLLSVKVMRETRAADRKMGQKAVQNSWLTQDQVDAALEEQARIFTSSKTVTSIGDILLNKGLLSKAQVMALSEDKSPDKAKSAEEEPAPTQTGEAASGEFSVLVSDDRLEAFIQPKGFVPTKADLSRIKTALAKNKITFGIIPDEDILEYLTNPALQQAPFVIARGKPPRPPQNPRIRYHFNTDPFKIGTVKKGGEIDFRDRGAVPMVDKDDLLAELVPGMEGVAGVNVLNQKIAPPRAKSVAIICGSGAKRIEGGVKAVALNAGRPEAASDGRIYVHPEHVVDGDVDFETGHVEFDGHVEVRGAIKDGFHVKSKSLVAREIQGGEVETEGDIVILGGAINADIKTEGNLRARYMASSIAEVSGDIVVENEIRNCRLETANSCLIRNGKILGSQIYANKSIEAKHVGTEAAPPSTLCIGIDFQLERELERLKAEIIEKEALQEKLKKYIEQIKDEPARFNRKIRELMEAWERAVEQKWNFLKDMKTPGDEGYSEEKTEKALRYLDSVIEEAQSKMEPVADQHEQAVDNILNHKNEIEVLKADVEEIHLQIERLADEAKQTSHTPFVKVSGAIKSRTVVKAPHATHVFPESIGEATIREGRTTDADGKVRWGIQVSTT